MLNTDIWPAEHWFGLNRFEPGGYRSPAWKEAQESLATLASSARNIAAMDQASLAIGNTAKDLVWQQDHVRLYRYHPLPGSPATTAASSTPLLLVYSQIGRYTMLDLQDDRSLVRRLLAKGLDLYVLDWGHPGLAERHLTIDDYVLDYLDAALRHVRTSCRQQAVDVLGICQGGVFSLLYAALFPDRIRRLVLTVTPVDFHADSGADNTKGAEGFMHRFGRFMEPGDIQRLVDAWGLLNGEATGTLFELMTPGDTLNKLGHGALDALGGDINDAATFLRMERWLADRPHHPAAAASQWVDALYRENQLAEGRFVLGGRAVDLAQLTMPILNIIAVRDHIVPPATAQALGALVGSQNYQELLLPAGHIGVFVSQRCQQRTGQAVANFLAAPTSSGLRQTQPEESPPSA